MALLVIVGVLIGAVVTMMIFKITRWWELIILVGLGSLATVCVYNGYVGEFFDTLTAWAR
ncbi:hypothetical protein ACIBQX_11130 [Nonomuraea sp. NPDC049714]|uniref:hypothetical protein n=1 Tax=Nonomuraea sp. NPDC049714 TaxID=3364357 RepID=UPI0037AA6891